MGKICSQEYFIQQGSFRIEGEIKSFSDKQTLKEFVITMPTFQEILKGTLSAKEKLKVTKRRKDQRNSPETMTKQVTKWQ